MWYGPRKLFILTIKWKLFPNLLQPLSTFGDRVYNDWLCSEFSVNVWLHGKTVHILRSSEPEAVTEPPPLAARSVLDRLA